MQSLDSASLEIANMTTIYVNVPLKCELDVVSLMFLWLVAPSGSTGSLRGKPPGADGGRVWEDGGLRRGHRRFHRQKVLH